MKLVFWCSVVLVLFVYIGYPVLLWFRARVWPHLVRKARICPNVTVVMAVYNEGTNVESKLRNLAELAYPAGRLDIIIISDGSTDETNKILAASDNPKLRILLSPKRQGKAAALNAALAEASGEIICFTDARQIISPDALNNLVDNFADPSVGCVSGNITLGDPASETSINGLGIYWWLETNMRRWEGARGNLIGAAGCLYAVRKELIVRFPSETILDDVYLPVHIAKQGKRIVFESGARGWDYPQHDHLREFRRKVRTLMGNYQLLQLAPWLLTRENPVRFEFVCHKVLRLAVPFALVCILAFSLLIPQPMYHVAFIVQIFCYALPLLALVRARFGFLSRMADVALAFLVLNTAAIVALFNFVTKKKAVWER